jgi:cysteine desulfurase
MGENMEQKIYLNNAATHKVCDSIVQNIQEWVVKFNNPSSSDEDSLQLRREIEEVRSKVAALINCDPEEIYFTSGSTESCAIAIDGFLKANHHYVVLASNIEHAAVLNNPNIDGFINCDTNGIIDVTKWDNLISCRSLYCFMLVNNEIGTIQPIKEISQYAHSNQGIVFSDLTAAIGHIPVDVQDLGIDIACFSGHKIGALKGVGVLYINKNVKVHGIMYGHQENGIRPGTYNYLGIKSLGAAISEIDLNNQKYILELRNYLYDQLKNIDDEIFINGHINNRIAGNLNICIPNLDIDNQQLINLLDMQGFVVSAGSACNSGTNTPSYVLRAIGLNDNQINRSIRITLSNENTKKDIDAFVECLNNIIQMHKISN